VTRRVLLCAAAVALVAALAGASGGSSGDPVRLTITFSRDKGAPRHVAHLRCTATRSRADGFLSRIGARRACAIARRLEPLLAGRPDPHRVCAEIFGGPERARVAGTIGDRRIRRAFSRTDGCNVADWRRAMPLLPRPS
jgi:hypothetical protein